MRNGLFIALTIILSLLMVGCVSMALPRVPATVLADLARPAALAADQDLADWESGRDALEARFLDEIYGAVPAAVVTEILDHRVIDTVAWDGAGRIEEYRLSMAGLETHLVTVLPNGTDAPLPVIILQMFCGNRTALGGREDISAPLSPYAPNCDGSWQAVPIRMVFGEFIMAPPVELLLERGYALAIVYPGDIVPDHAAGARDRLAQLTPDAEGGAIAAWAWVYSRIVDVLDRDARFDAERTAVWGHSRNGKSALLAGALDPRIDLVIAHQAGTGGTTLNRSHAGESLGQITQSYPHWFNARYAAYAGSEDAIPIDQHQLIALMAPRPLLIGGAWRDQWSDPQGSLRAAMGANPVYALYGSDGLRQSGLRDFDPDADIALFMRPGLHGVTGRDWSSFLAFLDAHFTPE
jgi:hypothetical protein